MEMVVQVEGLRKVFDAGVVAVDGISFRVSRGEIVGLLGPNGAGKTTTLHILLGLITPTSGSVRIFGTDPFSRQRGSILERINFTSPYVSLPYSLTLRENLRVFAGLYNIRDAEEKIDELLNMFGLSDIGDEPVRRLSSGQITRLGLAKALLNEPELLFLDEPTASLDPLMAERTRRLLIDINRSRGMTILYTSHNMKEMEELCHRIIFLNKGRIIAEGSPQEILERYGEEELERLFLRIAEEGEQ